MSSDFESNRLLPVSEDNGIVNLDKLLKLRIERGIA